MSDTNQDKNRSTRQGIGQRRGGDNTLTVLALNFHSVTMSPARMCKGSLGKASGSYESPQYFPKVIGFLSVIKDEEAECEDWTRCNVIRLRSPAVWSPMDPPSEVCIDSASWSAPDCATAALRMLRVFTLQRDKSSGISDLLAQMFNLPGCKELEQMKRAALSV
ncbi:hypothetical protein B0H19DRAFT_1061581 [Mycena capillaripes]|nr:hypothetical protein B0H19DRAFT_1061581 [Mycena capillaripes]